MLLSRYVIVLCMLCVFILTVCWTAAVSSLDDSEYDNGIIDDDEEDDDDGDDFQKSVISTNDVWLVIYYGAPSTEGGGYSDSERVLKLANELTEQAADITLKYDMKIGHVDCSLSGNKKTCNSANFRMQPFLQFFNDIPKKNPYTKKLYRDHVVFDPRSIVDNSSIERLISKNYPSHVSRVDEDEDEDANAGINKITALMDANKSLPSVILFTDKKKTSMLYKSLSVKYYGIFSFFEVTSATTSVTSFYNAKHSINSFPSLIYASNVDQSVVSKFTDDLSNRDAIIQWLHQLSELKDTVKGTANAAKDKKTSTDASSNKDSNNNVGDVEGVYSDPHKFTFDSLEVESAYVVAVVNSNAKVELGATEYKKIESWCDGVIRFIELHCAKFDASVESTSALGELLCVDSAVAEVPYLMMVPYGSEARAKLASIGSNGNTVSKLKRYSYALDEIDELKTALGDSLPETSVVEVHSEELHQFIGASLQAQKLPVIVLSDKSSVPVMLKNLGVMLDMQARIAFMSNPSMEIMASIGSPTLPCVIAAQLSGVASADGNQEISIARMDPAVFGPIRFKNVYNFVMNMYQRAFSNVNSGQQEQQQQGNDEASAAGTINDVHGEIQKSIIHITSNNEWQSHCNAAYRGICAIGFYYSDADVVGNIMQGVLNKIGNIGAAFKLLVVDAKCHASFADKFDVSEMNAPTISIYSPSKNRYATYRGSFTLASSSSFIDSTIHGNIATSPMTGSDPRISDECEYNSNGDGDDIVETIEDASDFLAEIRKEEEERQKQLKKDVEEEQRKIALEKKAKSTASTTTTKSKKTSKKTSKKNKKSSTAASEL